MIEEQADQKMKCPHCQRMIIANNFTLHQARCMLFRSSVRHEVSCKREEAVNQEEAEKEQHVDGKQIQEQESERVEQLMEKKRRRKIFEPFSDKQSPYDTFPCKFCGHNQTLSELDTHPLQCRFRQQPCSLCGVCFPLNLIPQHRAHCQARNRQQQARQAQSNPMGLLAALQQRRQNMDRHSQRNVWRELPPTMLVEGRPNAGSQQRVVFRGNGGPFQHFLGLLERMAARGQQQGEGLTKEEISRLERTTFAPASQEEQLCTICYCELSIGEQLIRLRCKHTFHQQCITKWLQKKGRCPLCKTCQTDRELHEQS